MPYRGGNVARASQRGKKGSSRCQSRYGGLRCPSEHLGLTWGDVDWENNRITIRSPKTEHHAGGSSRAIPLFPELRPFLEAAFDQAEPGTEEIITRYRDRNANLRTQLLRIIELAGVKPWPKLFHNLRAIARRCQKGTQHPLGESNPLPNQRGKVEFSTPNVLNAALLPPVLRK